MNVNLVSIIIPNYNKGKYIKEAIDSALNQTYKNIEVIVVDDGSTDESIEIIKSYGKKIKAYFLPHKNANVARNYGFKKSRGEYIQFLDSDDIISKDKIEKQVEVFKKEEIDIVLCHWRHFNDDGSMEDIRKIPEYLKNRELLKWILKGNWFSPCAPLYKRKFISDLSWDESLRRAQDSDFHFKVALKEPKIKTIKEVLAYYRNTDKKLKSHTEYRRIWLEDTYKVYLNLIPYIDDKEKKLLAKRLFHIGRNFYDINRQKYHEIIKKVFEISNKFKPEESKWYNLLYEILGLEFTEKIVKICK